MDERVSRYTFYECQRIGAESEGREYVECILFGDPPCLSEGTGHQRSPWQVLVGQRSSRTRPGDIIASRYQRTEAKQSGRSTP